MLDTITGYQTSNAKMFFDKDEAIEEEKSIARVGISKVIGYTYITNTQYQKEMSDCIVSNSVKILDKLKHHPDEVMPFVDTLHEGWTAYYRTIAKDYDYLLTHEKRSKDIIKILEVLVDAMSTEPDINIDLHSEAKRAHRAGHQMMSRTNIAEGTPEDRKWKIDEDPQWLVHHLYKTSKQVMEEELVAKLKNIYEGETILHAPMRDASRSGKVIESRKIGEPKRQWYKDSSPQWFVDYEYRIRPYLTPIETYKRQFDQAYEWLLSNKNLTQEMLIRLSNIYAVKVDGPYLIVSLLERVYDKRTVWKPKVGERVIIYNSQVEIRGKYSVKVGKEYFVDGIDIGMSQIRKVER